MGYSQCHVVCCAHKLLILILYVTGPNFRYKCINAIWHNDRVRRSLVYDNHFVTLFAQIDNKKRRNLIIILYPRVGWGALEVRVALFFISLWLWVLTPHYVFFCPVLCFCHFTSLWLFIFLKMFSFCILSCIVVLFLMEVGAFILQT